MGLSTAQSTIYQKIRTSSASKQSTPLSDDAIRILVYIAARDMGVLSSLPRPGGEVPELFDDRFDSETKLPGADPKALFGDLCQLRRDADSYVNCLAALHKARLKYRRIVSTQPFARMDQVGPRGLLQYGLVNTSALSALLVWRKWFYDLDNRAAQDTGYLVEPVITAALGGTSYPAGTSPIKRHNEPKKGRQVDCIKDSFAYEFKLRMTIAASGQGRWKEEIAFAEDCRMSGFTPVLVVLDPTESIKLLQLQNAFEQAGGLCYVGENAWEHLRSQAQEDMKSFLKKYVEGPLKELFAEGDTAVRLPSFEAHDHGESVRFVVGEHAWTVDRSPSDLALTEPDIPSQSEGLLPGF